MTISDSVDCCQSFDPDATPEQKAAAAGAARSQLAAVPGLDRLRKDKEGGRSECSTSAMVDASLSFVGVAIDTSGKAAAPIPTISIADVDKASRAEGQEVGGVSYQSFA